MSQNTTVEITGMTCGHCQQSVDRQLREVAGVTDVDISLVPNGTSTAAITSEQPLSRETIDAAVREAGYQLA